MFHCSNANAGQMDVESVRKVRQNYIDKFRSKRRDRNAKLIPSVLLYMNSTVAVSHDACAVIHVLGVFQVVVI